MVYAKLSGRKNAIVFGKLMNNLFSSDNFMELKLSFFVTSFLYHKLLFLFLIGQNTSVGFSDWSIASCGAILVYLACNAGSAGTEAKP